MKAKLTKLYIEHKCGEDWADEYPVDEVRVSLRSWGGGGCFDIVLETEVTVDCQRESHSFKVLKPGMPMSKAIRHAIGVFDALVAAHPTLGQGTPMTKNNKLNPHERS
jgi:hypothetical protein